MSIIIISRGVHYKGEEVAEKTAQKLGWPCISYDIVMEASKKFGVPDAELKKAMEKAPSLLERLSLDKEKNISFIHSVLLNRLKADNIIYHGQAGHFFVKDIAHALAVRILVDIKDRASYCMETEGVSEAKAYEILNKRDEEREKWGKYLYGLNVSDPNLYDVVINIQKLSVDDAVELICKAIGLQKFKTTPESKQVMEDLALAAEVRAVLMKEKPTREVTAKKGIVTVKIEASFYQEADLAGKIEKICNSIAGVKGIKVEPYGQTIEIVE
jgi:cytidylate kinase